MDKISNISIGDMPESPFLKPLRMLFQQGSRDRFWDMVKLHNSVSVLLYNTSRKVLMFVKQFRPAVFLHSVINMHNGPLESVKWEEYPAKHGITIELCAGILDNPKLTDQEIAKQEVLEECGYEVPLENFKRLITYRSAIGVGGNQETMFYAEVTDDMKVSSGGGKPEEGELIEVVEMTVQELKDYIGQGSVLSPGGFLYATTWFLTNKATN